jgi:signal transduction histidine kinase
MIVAERREGGLAELADNRSGYAPIWRQLDRNTPLWTKASVPVVVVTLLGTMLFGVFLAEQSSKSLDDAYVTQATAVADASAAAFYRNINDPGQVSTILGDFAAAQPELTGIWVVYGGVPGAPVVVSSRPADIGLTGLINAHDILAIGGGNTVQNRLTIDGQSYLETIVPVKGNVDAVVVRTSLKAESAAVTKTIEWTAVAAAAVVAIEITALMGILEVSVLGRIRRVRRAIEWYGRGSAHARLSEGLEPEGRDALFNLARKIDHKLVELSEHERAGSVVSRLGLLALQGVEPAELSRKALDITRQAADLERCFLVERGGSDAAVDSYEGAGVKTVKSQLPIWVVSLIRAAILARRPILADSFGQDCRYWAAEGENEELAMAAFVPMAGTPDPIGVIVGIARAGAHITSANLPLIEAVATALGESLQRGEAEKARHESEVKSNALATVSHEMRNPLNAMLGFSNLLLTGAAGPLNKKQETYVKRVDDASKHLLRLVNDYLDLARVMAGSLPMETEAVPVGPEVQNVLDMLGPTAEAKNVALRSQVAPDAIAHADRTRLRQVLMNLVSNGIKFTPARGYVRVEVAGGANGVRISVIDTGIGIPADRQHFVFTEFAQLSDQGGREAGTGLGLALTKRFVEAMGGFIRFTSSEGAGTIFDVWLPGERTPRGGAAVEVMAAPVPKVA